MNQWQSSYSAGVPLTAEKLTALGDRVIGVDLHNADINADLTNADLTTDDGRTHMVDRVRELTDGGYDATLRGESTW